MAQNYVLITFGLHCNYPSEAPGLAHAGRGGAAGLRSGGLVPAGAGPAVSSPRSQTSSTVFSPGTESLGTVSVGRRVGTEQGLTARPHKAGGAPGSEENAHSCLGGARGLVCAVGVTREVSEDRREVRAGRNIREQTRAHQGGLPGGGDLREDTSRISGAAALRLGDPCSPRALCFSMGAGQGAASPLCPLSAGAPGECWRGSWSLRTWWVDPRAGPRRQCGHPGSRRRGGQWPQKPHEEITRGREPDVCGVK